MGSRYRRTIAPQSASSAGDSTDPYAAYLNWVAQGRPSMSGGGAVKPEAATVLLSEHVQVQELAGGASPKPSAWQRMLAALRR
jgi:hypothetical protein